ncbi:PVC-type heme-binding CxxCH protein [Lacunimicrobium album]
MTKLSVCLPVTSLVLSCFLLTFAIAADEYKPEIAQASNEGQVAISTFAKPADINIKLIAEEPQMANPVAFCVDEQGNLYVAESFRQSKGIEDNRGHGEWMDEELQAQTVADRIAYIKKYHGDKLDHYTKEQDRVRLLKDTNDDGYFEDAHIFADGFNAIEDGTGAGLISLNGTIYYTCIPHLWMLRDNYGDGTADVKKSLHDGFGVRFAFRGHDMHGLALGPDGRIYFSIGDRGYNVTTDEGVHLKRPNTGAVFRCYPDGSGLEEFAYGLRNPQELAFDEYGNLFTGDNNSDGGDKARWVYVAQGMDAGWRMEFQYISDRGPWNRERMWHPYHDDETSKEVQPAYNLNPILNFADGPSGLTYDPGWGLPEEFRRHFFLADFRGSPNASGIRTFKMEPDGANFKLTDSKQSFWNILATDVDFAYDGSVYVADWVNGWNGIGKGRIYQYSNANPDEKTKALSVEVPKLMKEGFVKRSDDELVKLMGHVDQRVRLRAQYELATRKKNDLLSKIALTTTAPQLQRIHAVWGLGQIAQKEPKLLTVLKPLLKDSDPELIAQTLKVAAEVKQPIDEATVISQLSNANSRIAYFAAQAVAQLKLKAAFSQVVALLEKNADRDPVLRHACIMALSKCATPEQLSGLSKNDSRSVRLAAVVALRRQKSPEIKSFLNDADAMVVYEVAHAINDEPMADLDEHLATLTLKNDAPDGLVRRVLAANYRLGTSDAVERIAAIAANPKFRFAAKQQALSELLRWESPSQYDMVTNHHRVIGKRDPSNLGDALLANWKAYLDSQPEIIVLAAQLAEKTKTTSLYPDIAALLDETKFDEKARAQLLTAAAELDPPKAIPVISKLLGSKPGPLRTQAIKLLAQKDFPKAEQYIRELMTKGSADEQQAMIALLSELKSPEADKLLLSWTKELVAGNAMPEVQLDLLLAARKKNTSEFKKLVDQFNAQRDAGDPLSQWKETLVGGDFDRGKKVFFEHRDASCLRCHKIGGEGGAVGPDLSNIGKEKTREYLLAAIATPDRDIAKGFETTVVIMEDGKVHAGIVKEETADELKLVMPTAEIVTLKKVEILDRAPGQSGMPADIKDKITKSDIRDLVEYLSNLKGQASGGAESHGE